MAVSLLATSRPEDLWHDPAGDVMFGLDAIASHLGFPFLAARTMHMLAHIPTYRYGPAVCARKSELAAYFDRLERASCDSAYLAPAEKGTPLATDILRGLAAIAGHLGWTRGAARHHWERNGLPAFKIGKTLFARRASLDRYRVLNARVTKGDRSRVNRERRGWVPMAGAARRAGARICTSADVRAEFGLTTSMLYGLMARGKFPRPAVRFSDRSVGWRASDVAAVRASPPSYRPRRRLADAGRVVVSIADRRKDMEAAHGKRR